MTPQGSGGFGRRRCPVCGSRKLALLPEGGGMLLRQEADGKRASAPSTHWRCRSCGARMEEAGAIVAAALWRRRRPLANWLFDPA